MKSPNHQVLAKSQLVKIGSDAQNTSSHQTK